MESFGTMYPSVLKVPRFAMTSCRNVYDAHRTPASVFAEIFTPSASVVAAYASSPSGRTAPVAAAFTFGAYAPNHSARCDPSHFAAAGSGHSTVTVVVASNGTYVFMSHVNFWFGPSAATAEAARAMAMEMDNMVFI